jgi:hypothetical protein
MKFINLAIIAVSLGLTVHAFAGTRLICEDNSKSNGFHDHSADMYYSEGANDVIARLNKSLADIPANALVSAPTISGSPYKFTIVCVTVRQD